MVVQVVSQNKLRLSMVVDYTHDCGKTDKRKEKPLPALTPGQEDCESLPAARRSFPASRLCLFVHPAGHWSGDGS